MQIQTSYSLNCAFCLEDYKPKDSCLSLKCGHLFHENCVLGYEKNKPLPCPLCRKKFILVSDEKLESLSLSLSLFKGAYKAIQVAILVFSFSVFSFVMMAFLFQLNVTSDLIDAIFLLISAFFVFGFANQVVKDFKEKMFLKSITPKTIIYNEVLFSLS